jgi:hypothetical protein
MLLPSFDSSPEIVTDALLRQLLHFWPVQVATTLQPTGLDCIQTFQAQTVVFIFGILRRESCLRRRTPTCIWLCFEPDSIGHPNIRAKECGETHWISGEFAYCGIRTTVGLEFWLRMMSKSATLSFWRRRGENGLIIDIRLSEHIRGFYQAAGCSLCLSGFDCAIF